MNSRLNIGWVSSTVILVVAMFIHMSIAHGSINNPNSARVIKIVAQRFSFTPNVIMIKKGELIRLEITSLDFVHGFNVPDLKLRTDLPTGNVTVVQFVADKVGKFDFICDNFCGAGHEDMGGRIIVKE